MIGYHGSGCKFGPELVKWVIEVPEQGINLVQANLFSRFRTNFIALLSKLKEYLEWLPTLKHRSS
jgi:hypothetical protein